MPTEAWYTDAFTQKSLYKMLGTTKLAQSTSQYFFVVHSLYKVVSRTSLYYNTQRTFYTQKALHTASFIQRKLFTQRKLLYTASFYAEKLLHQESFYTQQAFTQRSVDTEKLPCTKWQQKLQLQNRDLGAKGKKHDLEALLKRKFTGKITGTKFEKI